MHATLHTLYAVASELSAKPAILSEAVPLSGTAKSKELHFEAGPPTQGPLRWDQITPTLIHSLFPYTPLANIAANLRHVLTALAGAGLTDPPMLLAALASIRAEAEPFLPLTEAESSFNTSPGGNPFDLYDHRADLGNHGPPDGANFRGRGYIQLTGRANYMHYGRTLSLDLINHPTLAAEPEPAARILAAFLSDKQTPIRAALAAHDLARARRLVNGGSHGLSRFTAAYTTGLRVFAPGTPAVDA